MKSNAQIKDIVDSEGIGYAIQDYMSASDIKDPVLSEWWEEARQLLNRITSYLDDHSDDGEDENDNED